MRTILLAIAIALVPLSCGQAADVRTPQYVFHIKIMQGPENEPDKCQILAQPDLVTTGDRPVHFLSGDKVKLSGEDVDTYGSQIKLQATPAADGKLAVRCTIEISKLVQPISPQAVLTTGWRANFNCQVEFKHSTKIVLRRDGNSATWVELVVDQVPTVASRP